MTQTRTQLLVERGPLRNRCPRYGGTAGSDPSHSASEFVSFAPHTDVDGASSQPSQSTPSCHLATAIERLDLPHSGHWPMASGQARTVQT